MTKKLTRRQQAKVTLSDEVLYDGAVTTFLATVDEYAYPSRAKFCQHLGITATTLRKWEKLAKRGNSEQPEDRSPDELKAIWIAHGSEKVKQAGEIYLQEKMLSGKGSPTPSIFLLKAQHGYREQDKVDGAGSAGGPVQIQIITGVPDSESGY